MKKGLSSAIFMVWVLCCAVCSSIALGADPNTTVAMPVFSVAGGTYNVDKTVTITCVTPGATIRYTLDGSDPNSGTVYEPNTPILIDRTMTLKAKAWKGSMTPSGIKSATYTLVVAMPAFSKNGGTYNAEQTVTITCVTPGATIRYTLDGSDPSSGTVYEPNTPILIDRTMTLKAKAWKGSMTPSGIKSATYTLVVAVPVFSKSGGTYNAEQTVMITCVTPGVTIRYTLDGSDPSSGTVYEPNTPISIDHSLTLKAKAWRAGLPESSVQSATYTLVVAVPVFSKSGGTYNIEQTVTITCATPGATIRYTLDGSDPSSGTVYEPNTPILIDRTMTLKAKAWKGSMAPSGIKSATYTLTVAMPAFSKNTGTYNNEKTVTVTCATPGAEIHYTLGSDPNFLSDPTESDPVVASGSSIMIDRTLAIKAKAWKENCNPSLIRSATFTLEAATPRFIPDGGNYPTNQNVTITCVTTGATVYYTLDGSDPSLGGTAIESGGMVTVAVDPTTILKAVALKDHFHPSKIKTASYHLASVMYVNASAAGANNGSSWADAFTSLQSALAAAEPNSNTEIWVAAGLYKPTKEVGGVGSRYRTFQLKNNVGIYGGFNGTESNRNQRDWKRNKTILSGDLNGNDNDGIPARQDNSYHVFYHPITLSLNGTAVLDGCIITGGNACAGASESMGGGMFNDFACPTVTNCTFTGNASNCGGGMCNQFSNPSITNCIFSGNSTNHGGGMANEASNPVILNCTFSGNVAGTGGGISNGESSPTITNSVFRDNSASSRGGGIRNTVSNPVITNCVFSGNFAGTDGGGIYDDSYGSVTLANSILWGNNALSGSQMNWISASKTNVSYSDIQGGWSGTGNIDADPLFVDAANGYLHLQAGSPCIDKGSDDWIPAGVVSDLDGSSRIIDGNGDGTAVVDMGAYEYYLPGDLNVTCSVDVIDWEMFAEYWLQSGCTGPDYCSGADIDHNTIVNQEDFAIFAKHWMK